MNRVLRKLGGFGSTAFLLAMTLPGGAAVNDPLPAGGTATEIDATVETNLVLSGVGTPIPLSDRVKAHAQCQAESAVFNGSLDRWEFTNSFAFLQGTFNDPTIGTVVISKNPALPIHGLHVTTTDDAVFPVHSRVRLFLQISAMGMTLVNRDPIVLEADINAWPEVGSVYKATTGSIDFFLQDGEGDAVGTPVAQLYGTRVTIEDSKTVTSVSDEAQEEGPG